MTEQPMEWPDAVVEEAHGQAGDIYDHEVRAVLYTPAVLAHVAALVAAAEARAYERGLREAAGVVDRMTAHWPHAGPVPAAVRGEWAARDKIKPAILALIPTTTIQGENA